MTFFICLSQTVQMYVLPPFRLHLDTFGAFQASTAWLPESSRDPFGRGASVMPWDRESKAHVLDDPR